jgi:hypothetical protein
MSAEVDWVLDQLASVVDAQPADHPLKRVDRDDSQVYDGSDSVDMTTPLHKRTEALKKANFVGARLADRAPEPIGTEFNHSLETVVGLRVEGLHHREWGHVDPAGSDGVVFPSLVRDIRRTLLGAREFPDPGLSNTSYHTLVVTNEDPQSAEYGDFYRWEADVVFRGYEDLP